jgi:hypothetical protein
MDAEREALAAMLMVCTNATREAALVAAQEEAAMEAARAAEEASAVAAQEEAARAVVRAEEGAADVAARTEMARDHHRWDEDMATARRAREIHELASEPHHRRNLPHAEGFRSIVNQKNSYGCEQESQDLI